MTMNQRKSMDNFAIVTVVVLSVVNLLHLLWTVWLTAEQIETGWGGGTGIEMMAILLWMTEFLCLPGLLFGLVYWVLSCFRRQKRSLLIANAILFLCALTQIGMTNLFLYM